MEERHLPPAFIRSGANFNVYPQLSRIKDRVASLKDFLHSIYKEIIDARLITQI